MRTMLHSKCTAVTWVITVSPQLHRVVTSSSRWKRILRQILGAGETTEKVTPRVVHTLEEARSCTKPDRSGPGARPRQLGEACSGGVARTRERRIPAEEKESSKNHCLRRHDT